MGTRGVCRDTMSEFLSERSLQLDNELLSAGARARAGVTVKSEVNKFSFRRCWRASKA